MAASLPNLLVQCLQEATSSSPRPVPLAGVGPSDLGSLAAAAEHHGIAPAVHRTVGAAPELPGDVAGALDEGYRRQWQVHLRALADLPALVSLLDGLDAGWVVVKGPVLVEGVYRRPDVRSYVDLDVFVDPGALPAVLDGLKDAGAALVDQNWTLIRRQVRGEISLVLRHGTALDLHWHPFNEQRVRDAFRLPMVELLERARRVDVNGVPTSTLDAEDTLIHLAAHAGLGGGYRLVWFKDLEQVVANDPPDWDEVVRRCRRSGLSLLVATMLARARTVLGAAVPADVPPALAPPGWRNVIAVADRLSPPQRSFGHTLTARTAVAATRRSGAASVAELARVVWADVVRPAAADPRSVWRDRRAARQPGSSRPNPLLLPAGDPEDRDAFLRLVAQLRHEP